MLNKRAKMHHGAVISGGDFNPNREREVDPICSKCTFWERADFDKDGICWLDQLNKTMEDIGTCNQFNGRLKQGVHIGDVVQLIIGTKWRVLAITKTMIICHDQAGKELSFDMKEIQAHKC
jgi:hypothetical protein